MDINTEKNTVVVSPAEIIEIANIRLPEAVTFKFNEYLECVNINPSLSKLSDSTFNKIFEAVVTAYSQRLGFHYIVYAGFSHERSIAYCAVFDTLMGAVEQVRSLYDLNKSQIGILIHDKYLPVSFLAHGVDFIEIENCGCCDESAHET